MNKHFKYILKILNIGLSLVMIFGIICLLIKHYMLDSTLSVQGGVAAACVALLLSVILFTIIIEWSEENE